jgi:glycosyltransferase involved in cell wall biosynthesis
VAARGAHADVVYPLVDARDYRVQTTRRRVLFVNPAVEKGFETARALAALEPDVAFAWTLCWDLGREGIEYLESEARRLGNVELRPTVLEPAELYGDARVLLVPSVECEAYGRVAREALTSGIPVIATVIGGLPESVGAGGVLMAPEATPQEWSTSLRCLLDDENLYAEYVARAEREAAAGATSAAVVVERVERLLDSVV